MTALICGSLAFDNVMTFQDRFRDHTLPDQLHILNVSFLVPGMKRDYGSCAGNIAHNLKLLGELASIAATIGEDGADYIQRMDTLGIDYASVKVMPIGRDCSMATQEGSIGRLPVESRARLPLSKSSTKAGRTISSRRTIFSTAVRRYSG